MNKFGKYRKLVEASTWIVMIMIIFGVRFLPQNLINDGQAYLIIGIIIAVALLYYLVIYKYFNKTSRMYLKEIADIILITVLIHVLKDYGQYFFVLYFFPIAAAALEMEFISALIIATVASVFVAFEIFLGSYDLLPKPGQLYEGVWQIGLILFITIFCRFLAIQIREEKSQKEEALARQKALETEALEEKEFMSLTSHQLYTPLSIIRGFASMLDDETLGELIPKQKKAADQIYQNTKRMVALVSELLSISRVQTGKIKLSYAMVNAKDLINDIVENFNDSEAGPPSGKRPVSPGLKNKKIKILAQLPENLQNIEIDSDKIRQVIYNLIDNALKYTLEGEIILSVSQDKKNTTFSIKDSGIGIQSEDFDKIFEPFFRGKNILELDNKGTGLGLYIARIIIQKHSGRIWFTSKEKRGSTFSFSVPNKRSII